MSEENEVVSVRESTREEADMVQWAEKAPERSEANIRDSLRQLITLATALLAGSAAMFTQPGLPFAAKMSAAILLMLSLGWGLWGFLPHPEATPYGYPDRIREMRERINAFRMNTIRVSALCLVFAFVVVFVGFGCAAFAW